MSTVQWLPRTQVFKQQHAVYDLLHLIGTFVVVTTAILQGNTASAIVVVTFIAGAALSTRGGTGDDIGETRAWRATGFRTDLIVTVFRTPNSFKRKHGKINSCNSSITIKSWTIKIHLDNLYLKVLCGDFCKVILTFSVST